MVGVESLESSFHHQTLLQGVQVRSGVKERNGGGIPSNVAQNSRRIVGVESPESSDHKQAV